MATLAPSKDILLDSRSHGADPFEVQPRPLTLKKKGDPNQLVGNALFPFPK